MIQEKKTLEEMTLAGLALPSKTTNRNGQSKTDCGNLWQKFEQEGYVHKIPHKLSNEVIAVYHNYEGDHTDPFAYFIGFKVESRSSIPDELDCLTIPGGNYQKILAKGKMPIASPKAGKRFGNRIYQEHTSLILKFMMNAARTGVMQK